MFTLGGGSCSRVQVRRAFHTIGVGRLYIDGHKIVASYLKALSVGEVKQKV